MEEIKKSSELRKIWTVEKLRNGTYCLKKYKGNDKKVIVPGFIGKTKVTEIASNCFLYNSDFIEEIDIDENIEIINTIGGCKNLKKLNFRKTPKKILGIGSLGNSIESFGIFGDVLYFKNRLIAVTKNISGDFIVKDGIEEISSSAFSHCSKIKNVTLPNSVKIIGRSAFSSCDNLEHINLENVEEIEEYAFFGCHNLKEINLSNKLNRIENHAFSCIGVSEINIPGIKEIPVECFSGCKNLKVVNLNPETKIIKTATFMDCTELTDISLPSTLIRIEDSVFLGCKKVQKINIPENIEIGEYNSDVIKSTVICLKDSLNCSCGNKMFPSYFNTTSRIIRYKCVNCGKEVEESFENVESNDDYEYFTLNSKGRITWKCFTHGYCDFDMDWFLSNWEDATSAFLELRCGFDK